MIIFIIMPTSQYNQIHKIIDLALVIKPASVLDVGTGFGKYGVLLREYLEYWYKDKDYNKWKVNIEGIEIYEKYITPLHQFIYDKIHCGNALEILPSLENKYDLILMIDVLEHFNYDDGSRLLDEAIKKGNNVLVSVPKNIGDKGASFGNVNETHQFQWKKKLLKKYNPLFIYDNESLVFCISNEPKSLRAKWNRNRRWYFKFHLKSNIIHYAPFLYKLYEKIKP